MNRAAITKRDGEWKWVCRETCGCGGTGYTSHAAAVAALLVHQRRHEQFGFRTRESVR
jgi:hypothetical protein